MRSTLAAVLSATVLLTTSITVAADLTSGHPRAVTIEDQWQMAVDVMTEPDASGGHTVRFIGPEVTYRIASDYPDDYGSTIREAFATVAATTGLTVRETDGPADVVVIDKDGHDAATTIWSRGSGVILRSVVQLGCCRTRPAYVDILQAFGPRGEHAPSGSIFTTDSALERPSEWDLCVLRETYRHPPATAATELRSEPSC